MEVTKYREKLSTLMDKLVHKVYDYTLHFPQHEVFGLTSQLRRASISIVLNYIEGYARKRKAVIKNFTEISFGSLKETQYLIEFSYKRKYLTNNEFIELKSISDEIARMLWTSLTKLS